MFDCDSEGRRLSHEHHGLKKHHDREQSDAMKSSQNFRSQPKNAPIAVQHNQHNPALNTTLHPTPNTTQHRTQHSNHHNPTLNTSTPPSTQHNPTLNTTQHPTQRNTQRNSTDTRQKQNRKSWQKPQVFCLRSSCCIAIMVCLC